MKSVLRRYSTLLLLFGALSFAMVPLTGCEREEEGTVEVEVEETGEDLGETLDETGDDMERTAEDVVD